MQVVSKAVLDNYLPFNLRRLIFIDEVAHKITKAFYNRQFVQEMSHDLTEVSWEALHESFL